MYMIMHPRKIPRVVVVVQCAVKYASDGREADETSDRRMEKQMEKDCPQVMNNVETTTCRMSAEMKFRTIQTYGKKRERDRKEMCFMNIFILIN